VELPFAGRMAELEAVKRFKERYPDGVAVLVDVREERLERAVLATAPVDVKRLAKQLAKAKQQTQNTCP